jgi:hypothetical protein
MITAENSVINMLSAPVRSIAAKVELYNGSTLVDTFAAADRLKSFTIDRVFTEGKFFGYGVCQKLNLKLIDKDRELNITTANSFKVYEIIAGVELDTLPIFNVTEVHRDENTNELSITAYDIIEPFTKITLADIAAIPASYTIKDFINYTAAAVGAAGVVFINIPAGDLHEVLIYEGANFEGSETIRAAYDAASEVLAAVYYVNSDNYIVFKRLDRDGAPVLTIDREQYITLKSGDNRRLSAVTHATELGDNVTASLEVSGSNQIFRDNPFIELREDAADILEAILSSAGGLTVNQFDCSSWRGNCLLEIGDKIALVTKDNDIVISYLLNDTITYNGAYSQATSWQYKEDDIDSSNPSTLGEALNKTFAKVDKVNKRIDIVASETADNSDKIASLQLNTDSIIASVTSVQEAQAEAQAGINEDIAKITKKVDAAMTAEGVRLEVQTQLENGANKVVTATGVTVDESGLTVDKTNSKTKTTISDDGLQVFKNDTEVLTANNSGVNAQNLHATTYLIIGSSSRLEDYTNERGEQRTGCFWIGGSN